MHKKTHIQELYLDYQDKRLSAPALAVVQKHLQECDDCREYFRKMEELLAPVGRDIASEIESDPFLPARVKSIVEEDMAPAADRRRPSVVSFALGTAGLGLAVAIGIFIGHGNSANREKVDTTSIATTYLESFGQQGFGERFTSALDSTREVKQ